MPGTDKEVYPSARAIEDVFAALNALRDDVETLRAQLNTHTHSGVTAGAANTGNPTTTVGSFVTKSFRLTAR